MKQIIRDISLSELNHVDFYNKKNVLIVTGKKSYNASGADRELQRIFSNCSVNRFSDFETNPRIEDVIKGLEFTKSIDLIVAVGGGSVIDMAKLLKAFSSVQDDPFEYIAGNKKLDTSGKLPLIALPTTSGSGSESTHFAVVYKDKVKYSLAHSSLLPDLVILDPALTMSMSSYQTACSGLDALAQSIESWWSVNAGDESKALAREGLELVLENLLPAVKKPDLENKRAMQKAANLAGKAINITKTTGPHAFCYYLTSHYKVPHGHAAALMLVPFLIYNSRTDNSERMAVIKELFSIMNADGAEKASKMVMEIMKSCGLTSHLSELMDLSSDFESFYDSVNLERLKNNPRPMDNKDEFRELLKY